MNTTKRPVRFEIVDGLRVVAVFEDGFRAAWTDAKTERGAKGRLTIWAKRYGFQKSADGKSAQ